MIVIECVSNGYILTEYDSYILPDGKRTIVYTSAELVALLHNLADKLSFTDDTIEITIHKNGSQ